MRSRWGSCSTLNPPARRMTFRARGAVSTPSRWQLRFGLRDRGPAPLATSGPAGASCERPPSQFLLGVLPRQLRSGWPLEPTLVLLQASPALPGPLQVVADGDVEPTHAFDLELHMVPVHEWVQSAVIGAGGEQVARLERVHGGDELNAARDLVRHVVGVEVLHQDAVVPESDRKVLRVGYFVGRHDEWPDRTECIPRLHLVEAVRGRRQTSGRAVDEVRVAEDVAHRLGFGHVRAALADDEPQLGLTLEDRCGHIREQHRVAVADDRVRRLVEGVNRWLLRQRAVLHVVHGHAVDVVRTGKWRPDPDGAERHTVAVRRCPGQYLPVLRPVLADASDHVLWMRPGDVSDRRAHVHDGVVLGYAELEVIKKK